MRISPFLKYSVVSLMIIVLAGCTLEESKDAAADRARDYIIEKIPRMSPQNATYIKCTYPTIVTAPIYLTAKENETWDYWNWGYDYYSKLKFSKSREYMQVAYTWDLPSPKISIMVVGTCYDNYQGWYPLRLIIRPTNLTTRGKPITPKIDNSDIDTFFKPIVGKSPTDQELETMQLP